MKILLAKSVLFLSLAITGSVGFTKEFMPPNLAFKPSMKGNLITISIAEGHYLYQDKISVISQNKGVKFSFINKPIIKKFPNQGTYIVYLEKAQIEVPTGIKHPITVRYQGCSSQGLCYPPQQATLKAK